MSREDALREDRDMSGGKMWGGWPVQEDCFLECLHQTTQDLFLATINSIGSTNMTSPLSPLSSHQLNSRTPATVVRDEKTQIDNAATTPCKANQDDVIDWDEEGSSPFVNEAESRNTSNNFDQPAVDPEVDAIFEDPSETQFFETSDNKTSDLSFSATTDKENMDALEATSVMSPQVDKENRPKTPELAETPQPAKKSRSPVKPKSTIKKRRSSTFEEDTAAMPPPSTRKTLRFNSPLKSSPMKQLEFASETPLPRSRDTSFEKAQDDNDDSVMMGADVDETNIDDTCFSTFSAVPDMTMFAKLGDARRSPLKQSIVSFNLLVCHQPLTLYSNKLLRTWTRPHRDPSEDAIPLVLHLLRLADPRPQARHRATQQTSSTLPSKSSVLQMPPDDQTFNKLLPAALRKRLPLNRISFHISTANAHLRRAAQE